MKGSFQGQIKDILNRIYSLLLFAKQSAGWYTQSLVDFPFFFIYLFRDRVSLYSPAGLKHLILLPYPPKCVE
jgi:hypothetical protein